MVASLSTSKQGWRKYSWKQAKFTSFSLYVFSYKMAKIDQNATFGLGQ